METHRETFTEEFLLLEGQKVESKKLQLLLISYSSLPLPSLGQEFITDKHNTVFITSGLLGRRQIGRNS